MDTIFLNWLGGIIESQGLIAVMMAYMIIAMNKRLEALLTKNCELNKFIMNCLERELAEEHKRNGSIVESAKSSQIDDLLIGGVIIPPATKAEP